MVLSLEDGETWQDCIVEFDVKFVEALHAQYSFVGVVYHHSAPDRYMYADFCYRWQGNQEVMWGVWLGGNNFDFNDRRPQAVALDTWYHLKLEGNGDHYDFSVDGKQILTFDDARLHQGRPGIELSGARILVDNVTVTGLSVPDTDMSLSTQPAGGLATTWAQLRAF